MALTINTNTASISAQRHLEDSQKNLDTAMERLSSGQRINSAKDDAAGLAIRDKMSSQIQGLNQSIRNANDAISLAQTAEGALEETTAILQRMRVLSMQSINDTNTDSDRSNLNDEFKQLTDEISRIGISSAFNNVKLLDGTFPGSTFLVGHNASETINLEINDTKADAIGSFNNSASFNITAAGTPTKGDSFSVTIAGADGNGGDLTVTYKSDKAESAKESAKGMVLALNSNSQFTQTYQAMSDANNSVVIRPAGGQAINLPIRAQFGVSGMTTYDTVAVTVQGIATGGHEKTITYTSTTTQSNIVAANAVKDKLNSDADFSNIYTAYVSDTDNDGTSEPEVYIRAKDGTNVDTSKFSVKQNSLGTPAVSTLSVSDTTLTAPVKPKAVFTLSEHSNGILVLGKSVDFTLGTDTVTITGDGTKTPVQLLALATSTNYNISVSGDEVTVEAKTAAAAQNFSADPAVAASTEVKSKAVFTLNEHANGIIATGKKVDFKFGTAGGDTVTITGDGEKTPAQLLDAASATNYNITVSGNQVTVEAKAVATTGDFDYTPTVVASTTSPAATNVPIISGITLTGSVKPATNVPGISAITNTVYATPQTQTLTIDSANAVTVTGNGVDSLIDLLVAGGDTELTDYTLSKDSSGKLLVTSKADGTTLNLTTSALGAASSGTGGTITIDSNVSGSTSVEVAEDSKIINEYRALEVSVAAGTIGVSDVVQSANVSVKMTDILSSSGSMQAVRVIDDALAMISSERSNLGAFQNRLEHAISNMANTSQNTQAARSVIADADYAKEAAELSKNQILQQAGTAMLAQANSQAETVLNLLK
jgi:flagellin